MSEDNATALVASLFGRQARAGNQQKQLTLRRGGLIN